MTSLLYSEKINQIENRLRPKYFIRGDSHKSIDQLMKELNIPGISLAIIDNFEVVWAKGYGISDIETKQLVDKDTIFQAASISKPVTALAVMKMIQDGIMQLDTNINMYLKNWHLPENEFTAKKVVTLRNLLSHNAGVTVHGFQGYKPDAPVPSLIQLLNGEAPANSGKIYVDQEPEIQWRYSGGGTTIVQQAMIDQESKAFQEIMQERVLNPVGMNNSFYSNSILKEHQLKNATAGHYSLNGEQVVGKRHLYPEMAAAGLWTTAEDLAKFAVEILKSLKGKSNKVLNKHFTEIMTTPVLNGKLCIGLFNEKIEADEFFAHGGSNEGYGCNLIFHKTKGYGLAVMANSDGGHNLTMPILYAAAKVLGWDNIVLPDYEKLVLSDSAMQHFIGTFQDKFDSTIQVYSKDQKLFCKGSCADETELHPVSNHLLLKADRWGEIETSADFEKVLFDGREIKRLSDGEKLGSDYIESGDLNKALDFYKDKLTKDADAHNWLEQHLNYAGCYLMDQTKYRLATGFLEINANLFPQSGNVWDSLGEVYFLNKRYELCLETMKKALEIDPSNQNAVSRIKESEEFLNKI